jgi:RimJ/RimL family protein N-acetyltransferase
LPAVITFCRVELLRTPRLLLRGWEEDDLRAFYEIYSHWEVMRWLGTHPRRALADLTEARERLTRWRAGVANLEPPRGLWAIVPLDESGGAPVGTALLLPLRDAAGMTGEIEIGWHLHPAHRKKGLATEAARALRGAAVATGIHSILALTDPDNTASQAVAARLDMVDGGLTDRWFGITTRQYGWRTGPETE